VEGCRSADRGGGLPGIGGGENLPGQQMISRRSGWLLLALLLGVPRMATAQTALERPFTLVGTNGRMVSDCEQRLCKPAKNFAVCFVRRTSGRGSRLIQAKPAY
jgi:hypothetical protein